MNILHLIMIKFLNFKSPIKIGVKFVGLAQVDFDDRFRLGAKSEVGAPQMRVMKK